MDLRHLRYFLSVAEELHFGRAAMRLGISQPPLSQQIRALEEELGVRLFDRSSRRVNLTEAGALFLPEAEQTLRQAERAMQTARLAHRGELGHLAFGYPASGPFVPRVAGALYHFRQNHPRVELTLEELSRDEQIARIAHRRLDMGLIRDFEEPVLPAGMISLCVHTENMVLALRADHPLARRKAGPVIADLAGEPLVLYGAAMGAGFNERFAALCNQAGFEPVITHEAGSLSTLLGLVAAGFGATVIAQSLARLHVDSLAYRPLTTPVISSLWLIHGDALSPTARAFKAAMLDDDMAKRAGAVPT